MPLPTYTDVHVDTALTDISVGYIQDDTNFVADRVFPKVGVVHRSDLYYKWSKDDFLRDEVRPRADTEESAGMGVSLTTDSYACTAYGLHTDIGDQARANQDPAVDLESSLLQVLMQKHRIKRDRDFATKYMKTSLWGTDITGVVSAPSAGQTIQWSDDLSDPVTDIANGESMILENTGFMPNVLVMGFRVFQALRKHPLVIDRIKYTMRADASNITEALLAQLFGIDDVVVGKAAYNTSIEGTSPAVNSLIIGKSALLAYRAPAPGLMRPSAGYIFPWIGLPGIANSEGVAVWTERMPGRGMNTIRIDSQMAYDMKAVSTDLGYYFTTVVA
ncbi:MAG: hypothetical protein ACREC4_00305 [Methylocella sp.]